MEQGLPNLPYEIIFDILSRLPVKSLCRFRSVSEPWLALITDSQFIKSHLNHQPTNGNNMNQKLILCTLLHTSPSVYSVDFHAPDSTVAELEMPRKRRFLILGSFNGILLFDNGLRLILWNPSIRKRYTFSQPKYKYQCGPTIYGLGYDSVSDDFKVVRAVCCIDGPSPVHLFTSKLRSWNKIGDFGYKICGNWSETILDGPGTILDGRPHWVVYRNTDSKFLLTTVIICFDTVEEKFVEVPKPNYEGEYNPFKLGVLGGWLCVVDHLESHSDIWVMKEYGVKESWTKLFIVPNVPGEFCFRYFELLCYAKDGEIVMALNSNLLVFYNPELNSYKRIGIPETCHSFDAAFYVESLVSPRGQCSKRRSRRPSTRHLGARRNPRRLARLDAEYSALEARRCPVALGAPSEF